MKINPSQCKLIKKNSSGRANGTNCSEIIHCFFNKCSFCAEKIMAAKYNSKRYWSRSRIFTILIRGSESIEKWDGSETLQSDEPLGATELTTEEVRRWDLLPSFLRRVETVLAHPSQPSPSSPGFLNIKLQVKNIRSKEHSCLILAFLLTPLIFSYIQQTFNYQSIT